MMSGSTARRVSLAATALAALGACGDDGGSPRDAAIDTPPDAPGTCGTADVFFTGEIVDWDSTDAKFCGVRDASFTVRGRAAPADLSNTNGRFELCIPKQAQTVVDIVPPMAPSGCLALSGEPMNTYGLQAVMIASDAVVTAGALYSARAMIVGRVGPFYAQVGEALVADHGQLFVHVVGTPRAVSISAAHAATQRFDGTTWAAGDTGSDVLFPNVVAGAAVTVSVAGGAVGTGSYSVEPGKLTYLTVIAN